MRASVSLQHGERAVTTTLSEVMRAAPQARIVTQFNRFASLETAMEMQADRMWLLNRGQSLSVGTGRSA